MARRMGNLWIEVNYELELFLDAAAASKYNPTKRV